MTTFSTASAIAIIWPSLLITALIIVIIIVLVLAFGSTALAASTATLALHHGRHAHHHVSAVGAAASRERPATRARLLKGRLDQLWGQLRADGVDEGLDV